jgi:hypothetical protein
MPGKLCTMGNDGSTSVLSFTPEGLYSHPDRQFSTPNISAATNAPYMPKWEQFRAGASFGFGNKLVSFNKKSQGLVTVHHCSSNLDLSTRMQEFDSQLESVTAAQICD